ncbi:hypothetical protein JR316_0008310 [Psilocybe cubensis]|uniref:Uncharacterized protein n=2 Tax=Psilocybe cubensis TaxID=181762 RepID=A0A8H8CIZ2_PSICU|nr:hypothetical protein JR316_0008310 [Psilocybe cubensis]KAH9479715.1 hypothetical protein JR316_0008310 [Psilocybe cubensis]
MKRKIQEALQTTNAMKRSKNEEEVFRKETTITAVSDELGGAFTGLKSLEGSKVTVLKRICETFKLQVAKSGGIHRPAHIKQDYINSILKHLLLLEDDSNEAQDSPLFDMDVDDDSNIQRIPQAFVKVRVYKNLRDYSTEYLAEVMVEYNNNIGVMIDDLKVTLGSDSIQVSPPPTWTRVPTKNGAGRTPK